MAETKNLLILRLEGAMQSWGENAKWDFRDSSSLPTKSGIVGLLGCAMGLERGSAVLAELAQSITVGIRADRAGVKFVDFQTVQGDPLMAATGKPKTTGNTILSPRAYLQDACFTVFIEAGESWQKKMLAALEDPRWCMYLGRKNCVPSRPVLECQTAEYSGLEAAMRDYPAAERAEYPMVYEIETPDGTAVGLLRSDDLVSADRQFNLRRVWRGVIKEAGHVSD
jgi:CRISPR system Cascade subunit CasD